MAFLFRRSRRREREGEEEGNELDRLLRAERSMALPVDPSLVKQHIVQEFYTRPLLERPVEELYIEELDKVLSEKAEQLYLSVIASTAQLSQQVLNVINSESLKASLMLLLSNVYAELMMKQYALTTAIEKIAKKLSDPSTSPDEREKLMAQLVDKVLTLLAMPRVLAKLLKDLDSRIAINVPFHVKPDLVRNLMGYTAT